MDSGCDITEGHENTWLGSEDGWECGEIEEWMVWRLPGFKAVSVFLCRCNKLVNPKPWSRFFDHHTKQSFFESETETPKFHSLFWITMPRVNNSRTWDWSSELRIAMFGAHPANLTQGCGPVVQISTLLSAQRAVPSNLEWSTSAAWPDNVNPQIPPLQSTHMGGVFPKNLLPPVLLPTFYVCFKFLLFFVSQKLLLHFHSKEFLSMGH